MKSHNQLKGIAYWLFKRDSENVEEQSLYSNFANKNRR